MKYIFLFILYSLTSTASNILIPSDKNVLSTINSIHHNDGIDPYDIDVLVWNIYKGLNEEWEKEFLNLKEDKELLLLQESVKELRVTSVIKRMVWYESVQATAWYDQDREGSDTGVMTLSKSPSLRKSWQRSFYLEPILNTPKMTLFTEYKLRGMRKTLLVGNIHGINFVRAYKLKDMLEEAAKVIESHLGPVIFAGDFNTWNKAKMDYMVDILTKLGMKMVHFSKDYRKTVLGNPLDHIWIKEINVLERKSIESPGSDHNPILVKLSVK